MGLSIGLKKYNNIFRHRNATTDTGDARDEDDIAAYRQPGRHDARTANGALTGQKRIIIIKNLPLRYLI